MKKIFIFIIASVFVLSVVSASMLIPANDNALENSRAAENSAVISESVSGEWELERIDFIHFAKPENPGKGGKKSSECYSLLGVKWKSSPVSYTINPSNVQGLDEAFVISTIANSAETWDDATSNELINDAYLVDTGASYGIQDYENVIDFGDLDSGIIGVTSVWFTRRGKQIVEFDIRLNTDFVWGDADLNSSLMDLENIVTHEMGHAVGLGDIYTTVCDSVTMYGYSGEGDTAKRTLEQSDIKGLQKMYGI